MSRENRFTDDATEPSCSAIFLSCRIGTSSTIVTGKVIGEVSPSASCASTGIFSVSSLALSG
ncbi:Uncharacterised protein [Vibrio cholerae]|nr:Uncharacterised protein [Vibrio cholerae]